MTLRPSLPLNASSSDTQRRPVIFVVKGALMYIVLLPGKFVLLMTGRVYASASSMRTVGVISVFAPTAASSVTFTDITSNILSTSHVSDLHTEDEDTAAPYISSPFAVPSPHPTMKRGAMAVACWKRQMLVTSGEPPDAEERIGLWRAFGIFGCFDPYEWTAAAVVGNVQKPPQYRRSP